jgi:transposase
MSLKPDPVGEIPEATARLARTVFRKGNVYLRLRDVSGLLHSEEGHIWLQPSRG